MKYVDYALMDVHTLSYSCPKLIVSFIYILLSERL